MPVIHKDTHLRLQRELMNRMESDELDDETKDELFDTYS